VFTSPPTAYAGVIYTSGTGTGGTIYAVEESTAKVRQMVPTRGGGYSSPAVTDKTVNMDYDCLVEALSLAAGSTLWADGTLAATWPTLATPGARKMAVHPA
jgi:hypothetical protein